MTTDVLYAFRRQSGDVLRMLYKLFQFGVHVIKRREYVDDRPQLFFPQDIVVFLFTAPYDNQSLGHGTQGIHGRRVGIKLVQQHIAVVHHPVVLCEGNGLRFHDFYPVGVTCG